MTENIMTRRKGGWAEKVARGEWPHRDHLVSPGHTPHTPSFPARERRDPFPKIGVQFSVKTGVFMG